MGHDDRDPFAQYIESVATRILGKPVSFKGDEMRYGSQGSLSVDVRRGVFRSFEDQTIQGGVLDFIVAFQDGIADHGDAVKWMRENGYAIPDRADYKPGERKPAAKPKPAPAPAAAKPKPAGGDKVKKAEIVGKEGEWYYADEEGEVLFRVVRYRLSNGKKTFSQERADGQGGFVKGKGAMDGVRLVPYMLTEVLEAVDEGRTVYLVEGEKNADRLRAEGLCATTNPMGAGKWGGETDEGRAMAEALNQYFRGANVVIIPDNDEPGRKHTKLVARELQDVAESCVVVTLPGLDTKEDAFDWFEEYGGTVPKLQELTLNAVAASDYGFETALRSMLFDEASTGNFTSAYLVENILDRGGISLVYGASGSGKSFLVTNLGLAVAQGVDFLGKYTEKGLVLYQAGEGKEGLKKRLAAYRKEKGVSGLPFVLVPEEIDIHDPQVSDEQIEKLVATFEAYVERLGMKPALIVIDTLHAASPGADENASQDMGRILTAIKKIRDRTGAHVLVVHHKNAGGDKSRGHTSLYAGVDNAIEVNHDEETGERNVRVAKLKEDGGGERIGFVLKPVAVGHDERANKPITSCVVEHATAQAAPRADSRSFKLDQDAKLARKVIETTYDRSAKPLPSIIKARLGPNTIAEGVSYDDVLEMFVAQTPAHDRTNKKAMGKRLDSRLAKLQIAGVVSYENGWVWWR